MSEKIKFLFDLDGTLTRQETLPLIAQHFHLHEEIQRLTQETIQGKIPFRQSFLRRVAMLGALPIDEINVLLENVPLYEKLVQFIQSEKNSCAIVTGNLSCWIENLSKKFACEIFASHAEVKNNRVICVRSIVEKELIVKNFQEKNFRVVYLGDGDNDVEAMKLADFSIAVGLTHEPAPRAKKFANISLYDEEKIFALLNHLNQEKNL